jgi:hypothetical protein
MLLVALQEGWSSKVGGDAQTAVAEVKEHAGRGDKGDEAAAQFGMRILEEVEETGPTLLRGLQDLGKLGLVVKERVNTMCLVMLTAGKQALMTG